MYPAFHSYNLFTAPKRREMISSCKSTPSTSDNFFYSISQSKPKDSNGTRHNDSPFSIKNFHLSIEKIYHYITKITEKRG